MKKLSRENQYLLYHLPLFCQIRLPLGQVEIGVVDNATMTRVPGGWLYNEYVFIEFDASDFDSDIPDLIKPHYDEPYSNHHGLCGYKVSASLRDKNIYTPERNWKTSSNSTSVDFDDEAKEIGDKRLR